MEVPLRVDQNDVRPLRRKSTARKSTHCSIANAVRLLSPSPASSVIHNHVADTRNGQPQSSCVGAPPAMPTVISATTVPILAAAVSPVPITQQRTLPGKMLPKVESIDRMQAAMNSAAPLSPLLPGRQPNGPTTAKSPATEPGVRVLLPACRPDQRAKKSCPPAPLSSSTPPPPRPLPRAGSVAVGSGSPGQTRITFARSILRPVVGVGGTAMVKLVVVKGLRDQMVNGSAAPSFLSRRMVRSVTTRSSSTNSSSASVVVDQATPRSSPRIHHLDRALRSAPANLADQVKVPIVNIPTRPLKPEEGVLLVSSAAPNHRHIAVRRDVPAGEAAAKLQSPLPPAPSLITESDLRVQTVFATRSSPGGVRGRRARTRGGLRVGVRTLGRMSDLSVSVSDGDGDVEMPPLLSPSETRREETEERSSSQSPEMPVLYPAEVVEGGTAVATTPPPPFLDPCPPPVPVVHAGVAGTTLAVPTFSPQPRFSTDPSPGSVSTVGSTPGSDESTTPIRRQHRKEVHFQGRYAYMVGKRVKEIGGESPKRRRIPFRLCVTRQLSRMRRWPRRGAGRPRFCQSIDKLQGVCYSPPGSAYPHVDIIDGLQFYSFDSEADLRKFVRRYPSRTLDVELAALEMDTTVVADVTSSLTAMEETEVTDKTELVAPEDSLELTGTRRNPGDPIRPTKTRDVTKIKGWRCKVFAEEALAASRLAADDVRQLNHEQDFAFLQNGDEDGGEDWCGDSTTSLQPEEEEEEDQQEVTDATSVPREQLFDLRRRLEYGNSDGGSSSSVADSVSSANENSRGEDEFGFDSQLDGAGAGLEEVDGGGGYDGDVVDFPLNPPPVVPISPPPPQPSPPTDAVQDDEEPFDLPPEPVVQIKQEPLSDPETQSDTELELPDSLSLHEESMGGGSQSSTAVSVKVSPTSKVKNNKSAFVCDSLDEFLRSNVMLKTATLASATDARVAKDVASIDTRVVWPAADACPRSLLTEKKGDTGASQRVAPLRLNLIKVVHKKRGRPPSLNRVTRIEPNSEVPPRPVILWEPKRPVSDSDVESLSTKSKSELRRLLLAESSASQHHHHRRKSKRKHDLCDTDVATRSRPRSPRSGRNEEQKCAMVDSALPVAIPTATAGVCLFSSFSIKPVIMSVTDAQFAATAMLSKSSWPTEMRMPTPDEIKRLCHPRTDDAVAARARASRSRSCQDFCKIISPYMALISASAVVCPNHGKAPLSSATSSKAASPLVTVRPVGKPYLASPVTSSPDAARKVASPATSAELKATPPNPRPRIVWTLNLNSKSPNVVASSSTSIFEGRQSTTYVDDEPNGADECRVPSDRAGDVPQLPVQDDDEPYPPLPDTVGSSGGCVEVFCRLGCVCTSLQVRRRKRRHCGKVQCMFACTCFGGLPDEDEVNAGDSDRLKRGAGEAGALPHKRRRQTRLPAKLQDSAYRYGQGKQTLIRQPLLVRGAGRGRRLWQPNSHLQPSSSDGSAPTIRKVGRPMIHQTLASSMPSRGRPKLHRAQAEVVFDQKAGNSVGLAADWKRNCCFFVGPNGKVEPYVVLPVNMGKDGPMTVRPATPPPHRRGVLLVKQTARKSVSRLPPTPPLHDKDDVDGSSRNGSNKSDEDETSEQVEKRRREKDVQEVLEDVLVDVAFRLDFDNNLREFRSMPASGALRSVKRGYQKLPPPRLPAILRRRVGGFTSVRRQSDDLVETPPFIVDPAPNVSSLFHLRQPGQIIRLNRTFPAKGKFTPVDIQPLVVSSQTARKRVGGASSDAISRVVASSQGGASTSADGLKKDSITQQPVVARDISAGPSSAGESKTTADRDTDVEVEEEELDDSPIEEEEEIERVIIEDVDTDTAVDEAEDLDVVADRAVRRTRSQRNSKRKLRKVRLRTPKKVAELALSGDEELVRQRDIRKHMERERRRDLHLRFKNLACLIRPILLEMGTGDGELFSKLHILTMALKVVTHLQRAQNDLIKLRRKMQKETITKLTYYSKLVKSLPAVQHQEAIDDYSKKLHELDNSLNTPPEAISKLQGAANLTKLHDYFTCILSTFSEGCMEVPKFTLAGSGNSSDISCSSGNSSPSLGLSSDNLLEGTSSSDSSEEDASKQKRASENEVLSAHSYSKPPSRVIKGVADPPSAPPLGPQALDKKVATGLGNTEETGAIGRIINNSQSTSRHVTSYLRNSQAMIRGKMKIGTAAFYPALSSPSTSSLSHLPLNEVEPSWVPCETVLMTDEGTGGSVEVACGESLEVSGGKSLEVSGGETLKVSGWETLKVNGEETLKISGGETVKVSSGKTVKVSLGETLKVGCGETLKVGCGETLKVGGGETLKVGSGKALKVGGGKTSKVGSGETSKVGGSETLKVGGGETLKVGGGGKTLTVGCGETSKVGSGKTLMVGGSKTTKVGSSKTSKVGGETSKVGGGGKTSKVGGVGETLKVGGGGETLKVGGGGKTLKVSGGETLEVSGGEFLEVDRGSDVSLEADGVSGSSLDDDNAQKGNKSSAIDDVVNSLLDVHAQRLLSNENTVGATVTTASRYKQILTPRQDTSSPQLLPRRKIQVIVPLPAHGVKKDITTETISTNVVSISKTGLASHNSPTNPTLATAALNNPASLTLATSDDEKCRKVGLIPVKSGATFTVRGGQRLYLLKQMSVKDASGSASKNIVTKCQIRAPMLLQPQSNDGTEILLTDELICHSVVPIAKPEVAESVLAIPVSVNTELDDPPLIGSEIAMAPESSCPTSEDAVSYIPIPINPAPAGLLLIGSDIATLAKSNFPTPEVCFGVSIVDTPLPYPAAVHKLSEAKKLFSSADSSYQTQEFDVAASVVETPSLPSPLTAVTLNAVEKPTTSTESNIPNQEFDIDLLLGVPPSTEDSSASATCSVQDDTLLAASDWPGIVDFSEDDFWDTDVVQTEATVSEPLLTRFTDL